MLILSKIKINLDLWLAEHFKSFSTCHAASKKNQVSILYNIGISLGGSLLRKYEGSTFSNCELVVLPCVDGFV